MSKQFPCPVTTIFARRVRPGSEERYETWLHGINQAAASFPGHQGVTVLRPEAGRAEYVVVAQFDSTDNLDRWLDSDERRRWLDEVEPLTLDAQEVATMTGMERWFTLPDRSVAHAPPRWKTALLLFAGLYPTALILGMCLQPLIASWPSPLKVFASLAVSIPVMVWGVMPMLTRLFFGWLYPEPGAARNAA